MNKGRLIVVSGPSGTGKGTVCKELIKLCPELALSISWTTRPMRPGDEEGVTYFFKTEEEYDQMVAQDGFLEYAGIYGGRYGTPKTYVEARMSEGRDVILEIETKGAMQVMEKKEYETISIFLLPPSMGELKKRLYLRASEAPEKAERRFREAYDEVDLAHYYDYVIINDDLDQTTQNVLTVIRSGLFTPGRAMAHIAKLKEEKVL